MISYFYSIILYFFKTSYRGLDQNTRFNLYKRQCFFKHNNNEHYNSWIYIQSWIYKFASVVLNEHL